MPDLSTTFSPQQLASAIKAKRTGMMLRVVDVAAALELSRQTIIKIEKGDTTVNFSNLLRVMELLGLSFRIITDGASPKSVEDKNIGEPSNEWF
ncbi:Helix-turn-helix protein [Idiomarina sp. A28L]|uniref:helix-turn-helix domain-containing protein n=1 Tax=Idiomarina sp. A28L TaxID=1036674 RepID=UPI0002138CC4|nr:helix-turn-helix domain-containing protein [Idiomarina sp. A28L]EGN74620.1 Helix-turn-helix protein [Idiomarina sp. A28L]